MVANSGKLSTMNSNPTTILTDKVDSPHSGLFTGIHSMAQGNYALKNHASTLGFAHTFTTVSGVIKVALTAGTGFSDGKYIAVGVLSAHDLTKPATGAFYHWAAFTDDGDGTGTADIILGSTDGVVPELTAGSTPISLIKIQSTDTHSTAAFQTFTTSKTENALSIGYSNSNVYTETAGISGVSGVTTVTAASGTDVKVKLAGTAAGDTFEVIDSAAQIQLKVQGDGVVNVPALTASRALVTDVSNNLGVSATTSTELGYVSGVSSAIQTQINTKAPIANPTFTGEIGIGSVNVSETELGILEGATLTTTELNYVDGVSSAIQTQLNAKQASLTFGISNTNAVKIDSASVADDEFARFTANGLESRSTSEVLSDIGGAALTGSTNNTITTVTGANAITGEANLTFDASTDILRIQGSDGGAGIDPSLVLARNSASPANNDNLGNIDFEGRNASDDADVNYARIYAKSVNISDTNSAKEGAIYFVHFIKDTSATTAQGNVIFGSEEVSFNNQEDNLDFRVSSDDESHMFFVDGGNNRISIGDSVDAPAATLEITNHATAGAFGVPLLQLNNNDTDKIALDIDAANINADVINILADALTSSHGVHVESSSLTTGSALSILSDGTALTSTAAGGLVEIKHTGNTGATVNNLVHIHNDHASATGVTGLKVTNDSTGPLAHFVGAAVDNSVIIEGNVDPSSGGAPDLVLYQNPSGNVQNDDTLAHIRFRSKNDASQDVMYADIYATARDVADGTEDGDLNFRTMQNGTEQSRLYLSPTEAVFNDNSNASDFRIETNNKDDTFFVDGTNDRVGIVTNAPANVLDVRHTGADGDNGIMIVREDASTADGDLLGGIGFDSTDGNVPSSVLESSAFIASIATEEHTTADKGGNLKFGVSIIDEDDDTVSTIVANVGQPDTITASAGATPTTHAGLNSRVTTVVLGNGTYSPTVGDSGTLVIFEHASSTLALPAINNTTSVGVQFTVFNETGSAINAQITVQNSATVNGGAIAALDDIASYKAATFVCSGNNTWIRIG